MRMVALIVGMLLGGASAPLYAHGVQTSIDTGRAVVVTATYADGAPMAFESCEVRPPGDAPPFMVGRTDRLGRVVFVPDCAGDWQVRVTTEDGHGAVVPVEVNAGLLAWPATQRDGGHVSKLVTGVGVLLGVFGLVTLIQQRRTR